MKTSGTIILALLICAAGTARAGAADERGGHLGMGAGAAAGALIGGPPGAILGAGLGAFAGDRAERAAEAARLSRALTAAQADADRLQIRLAATGAELAAAEAAVAELERRQALARALELEVLFRTDSSELGPAATARIERLAGILRAHPGLGVRLDGHADARGDADHNEALSAARADAVREALVARGVDPGRIAGEHHGARAARAPADDAEAMALDRRVAIRLVPARHGERVAKAEAARD